MREPRKPWSAVRTTLVYVAVAVTWIVATTFLASASDGLFGLSLRAVELVKGLLFVAVSGTALWLVTSRFEHSLRASEARRRELLEQSLHLAEEARQRTARDVQEDAIQLLAAAGLRLDASAVSGEEAGVVKARALLDDGVRSLRRIILELEPPELTAANIEPLVAAYAGHILDAGEVEQELRIDLPTDLDAERLTAVYRIVVEALSNVARHADPDRVSVVVAADGGSIVGRVVDDGAGMASEGSDPDAHLGIRFMRERAERLGGDVTVRTNDGGGTTVTFTLPVEPSAPRA